MSAFTDMFCSRTCGHCEIEYKRGMKDGAKVEREAWAPVLERLTAVSQEFGRMRLAWDNGDSRRNRAIQMQAECRSVLGYILDHIREG